MAQIPGAVDQLEEAVDAPESPIAPPPQSVRIRSFLRRPAVWGVALSFIAGLFFFGGMQYLRLARMADRRLAEGPFAQSLDILATPHTISAGDTISEADLVQTLERSGYTRVSGDPGGWYELRGNAVQIHPGSEDGGDTVRIEFAKDKIAAITSLRDRIATRTYQLHPPFLTNLSANREKRRLVRFAEVPTSLVNAITSTEDKRFFDHWGFDYRRMLKAAYLDFRDNRKQQGASTLTMQLARAFFLEPAKSWRRKGAEILITLHLEHKLTKQQIFEDYVNEIYLGRRGTYNIHGVGEAARVYFNKEINELDVSQAALLAGIIQRPSYFNPFRYPERALNRRNVVLSLMRRNGHLSEAAYETAVNAPLKMTPPASSGENSYFLAMMNDELQNSLGDTAGRARTIVSTLDPELQQAAEAAVRSGMDAVDQLLRKRKDSGVEPGVQPQVALVAIDPRTGEVKAVVGGRNYGDSQLNHAVAMRQPGSVFKPFVYAAAIDSAVQGGNRLFTPATVLNDEATTFYYHGNVYDPKNFHNDYQGPVTLRRALAHSLNVATVSLAQQVGYQRVVNVARRAGLNDKISATPAVALGAYEATPLEMAGAYTVFANQGLWVKPTFIREVRDARGAVLMQRQPQTKAALDPRVAYVTTNLMQEVLRSGTGAGVRSRGFTLPAAGKTGTSRDGWFAGFTSELLCVVWVGFDDNRELNLEGAKSALPIWTEFMKRASKFRPYSAAHDFQAPNGISRATICEESGELAGPFCSRTRAEVFIAGTEPADVCAGHDPVGVIPALFPALPIDH